MRPGRLRRRVRERKGRRDQIHTGRRAPDGEGRIARLVRDGRAKNSRVHAAIEAGERHDGVDDGRAATRHVRRQLDARADGPRGRPADVDVADDRDRFAASNDVRRPRRAIRGGVDAARRGQREDDEIRRPAVDPDVDRAAPVRQVVVVHARERRVIGDHVDAVETAFDRGRGEAAERAQAGQNRDRRPRPGHAEGAGQADVGTGSVEVIGDEVDRPLRHRRLVVEHRIGADDDHVPVDRFAPRRRIRLGGAEVAITARRVAEDDRPVGAEIGGRHRAPGLAIDDVDRETERLRVRDLGAAGAERERRVEDQDGPRARRREHRPRRKERQAGDGERRREKQDQPAAAGSPRGGSERGRTGPGHEDLSNGALVSMPGPVPHPPAGEPGGDTTRSIG